MTSRKAIMFASAFLLSRFSSGEAGFCLFRLCLVALGWVAFGLFSLGWVWFIGLGWIEFDRLALFWVGSGWAKMGLV